MLGSIKDSLHRLAEEDDFFEPSKQAQQRLLPHVRSTLKRYKWQYHPGIDLAELLGPFLLAINIDDTHACYGPKTSSPTLPSYHFPPREHDADDYEADKEPWIAAFFQQWAVN
jgi:hypothetical protein